MSDGWTLCRECRKRYAQTLHSLRIALRHLRQIANREVTLEHGGHADPAIPQAPVNLSALDLYDSAWERIGETAATIGVWGSGERILVGMMERMADLCRTSTAGADMRSMSSLLARVRSRSDRRERRTFAGLCPGCGRDVESDAGDVIVRCSCGMVIDARSMREETMAAFDRVHITATPAGAARWCVEQTGERVTRKDVDNWRRRGTLSAEPDGERCYRYPVGQLLRNAREKTRRLHPDAVL